MKDKVYILVYREDDSYVNTQCMRTWLDTSPLVKSWRRDFPDCVYLVSDSSSGHLREALSLAGIAKRFLFAELGNNINGRLPADSWYFFHHMETKSRRENATEQ